MSLKEYVFTDDFEVTDEVKQDFDEAGYVILRGLLDKEELLKVKDALEGTDALLKNSFQVNDSEGRKSRLCLWSHPGNDVTGMVGRCEKVAGTSEKLLGGEVYHYHTKLMMKEPFTGGEHVWHQDYGYWYKNGCLFPDMLTVFIAIDKCWKENGCLQILQGSHKCGRIEHVMVGGQTGADVERVDQIKKVLPLHFVELEPGDALFFHSNLLTRPSVLQETLCFSTLIYCTTAPLTRAHIADGLFSVPTTKPATTLCMSTITPSTHL
ncbi:L-proline trans-4-hydroxylase-like isoform X2 [Physella acuta]|uniref:L-proline trans-4-hydroxylase-like isoform X2 n=1 Tax=Physella acuta TaxID=109671 RepID=UPI0027DE8142|nr:L-proline trans-4-hydroxylase-like isoform X2 [Physella acuta]